MQAEIEALRAKVASVENDAKELRKSELVAVGAARTGINDGPKRRIRVTELAPAGFVAQVRVISWDLYL